MPEGAGNKDPCRTQYLETSAPKHAYCTRYVPYNKVGRLDPCEETAETSILKQTRLSGWPVSFFKTHKHITAVHESVYTSVGTSDKYSRYLHSRQCNFYAPARRILAQNAGTTRYAKVSGRCAKTQMHMASTPQNGTALTALRGDESRSVCEAAIRQRSTDVYVQR